MLIYSIESSRRIVNRRRPPFLPSPLPINQAIAWEEHSTINGKIPTSGILFFPIESGGILGVYPNGKKTKNNERVIASVRYFSVLRYLESLKAR
jgi:hypothetical protein